MTGCSRRGEVTTSYLDETPRTVPVHAAPGPGDPAARLPGRGDRERQPGGGRQAHPRPVRSPPRCRRTIPPKRPREPGSCWTSWARKVSREWTRKQKRLLITDTTFRDAHQSLLATRVRTYDMLANCELRAPGTCPDSTAWRCGAARRSTRRCASCTRIRGSGCGRLREAIPNICFQMLLRGFERRRLHDLSGQRGACVRRRGGRPGHRHLPHFRFAQLAAEHARGDGGRAATPASVCEAGHLLHRRHPRPRRDKSTRSITT